MNTDTYIRRRPVYLLLDTSSSMLGSPIQAVEQGLRLIYNELMNNPHAIETVYLSVITFADAARQVIKLCSVEDFKPPTLAANGSTALGAAMTLLDQVLDRELIANSEGRKGDYRPLVFLLTDGAPTDEWREAVNRLKARKQSKLGAFVALGCGPNVNLAVLREITSEVLIMNDVSSDSIRQFFKWVSSSIQKTSQRLEAKADETGLEAMPLPPVMKWNRD
ncbi:MAG: VWA domain-containing protein [Anaerolineae bacterium]